MPVFLEHILSEGQVWADFGQGPGDTRGARPTSVPVLMELTVPWERPTNHSAVVTRRSQGERGEWRP